MAAYWPSSFFACLWTETYPASRGLSRWGKMKREERDLCRLPMSFLSRMRWRFLNNQWRLCHAQNNPENHFEFECEHKRQLNLSTRSNFKWTNQSWGWNGLASGCCTSLWGKQKRQILKQIFHSSQVFRPPKHTYLEWNLLGSMKLLFIAIRDCSFWGESDLWSDVWPAMDGVVSLLAEVSYSEAKVKDLL